MHSRNVPEGEPSPDTEHCPQHCTQNVVQPEFCVGHGPNAGYEGRKGAHDGHETSQDDCFAAVRGIEALGALDVVALDERRLERLGTKVVSNCRRKQEWRKGKVSGAEQSESSVYQESERL